MNRAAGPLRAVLLVVPVHDEEELLPACLTALDRAAIRLHDERPDVELVELVVLDGCTDGSADVVRRAAWPALAVPGLGVGAARRAGVEALAAGRLARRTWVACTDGDSEVPDNWLVRQVELADAGADVVVGTVRPRLADLSPDRAAAWLATHEPGVANGHVHGANLGVRLSTYRAAGGFAAVHEHEDVALVDAAGRGGARIVADAQAEVLTSGRLEGRTPGGYARHLRDDLLGLPAPATVRQDLAG